MTVERRGGCLGVSGFIAGRRIRAHDPAPGAIGTGGAHGRPHYARDPHDRGSALPTVLASVSRL